MSVEVTLGTPLAEALHTAIQGKIAELGWAGPGAEGSAMSEYFLLMLANGKTDSEIASEIAGDLLGLGPDDQTAPAFSKWLFEQIEILSSQLGTGQTQPADAVDGPKDESMDGSLDVNMDTRSDAPAAGLNAPTGPKAMRNGNIRGGREKRMMGQINRALDRTQDSILHRVRTQSGNERIGRGPPAGPRMGVGRQPRTNMARATNIAAGLANMGGMPTGPMGMNGAVGMNPMNGAGFAQADIIAMMEQQNLMLQQMQQQLLMQQQQNGMARRGGHGPGKHQFDRNGRPSHFRRGGAHPQHNGHVEQQQQHAAEGSQPEAASPGDVEMTGAKREPPNPDETVCRFNLRCQNKDCKFAHQSPAAPPGITIDVKDVCSFGAACKNRKCVGRHPSPATKAAHQSEQDCKFFPNCINPHCPFRHPTMPPCRNGGECKVPNCKFTHVTTPCKFHPCTNRTCPFMHEEGQRGTFQDKVWTANDGSKEHVSERKFVNEDAPEDVVLPGSGEHTADTGISEVVIACYGPLRRQAQFSASSKLRPTPELSCHLCGPDTTTATPRSPLLASANHDIRVAVDCPRSIAVLGGGLTGLTTAWYLARNLPGARITIYEASDRLGGWVDTTKVNLKAPDGTEGTVHFEHAARMVKPQVGGSGRVPRWDDLVFFDMVANLGLSDQLVHSLKEEETVDGYIYYPDHLVAVPTTNGGFLNLLAKAGRVLTEPVFRDLIPALFNIITARSNPYEMDLFKGRIDMSLGDYYAHRFGGPGLVDKAISAMVHGITGGDVWKQSIASGPWADMVVPSDQPLTNVRVRRVDYEMMTQIIKDKAVFDLASQHLGSSALWFRNGFSTLTNALADALKKNPNVTIRTGDPVESVRYLDDFDRVFIATKKNKKPVPYEKVVSTLYSKTLANITDGRLPSLAESSAVTIMLVNIWYPVPGLNSPYNGFGYLLPQALPHDANPECILGVIFDSDREFRLSQDDFSVIHRGADTLVGTKLTVMMGGHYWDDLPPSFLPDPESAIAMAKRAVQRHLPNIDSKLSAQAYAQARLLRDCIPQHLVGHAARMRAAHADLEWGFKGRLAVAGQSYQSPGVLYMLRAGRDMAMQIAGGFGSGSSTSSSSSSSSQQQQQDGGGEGLGVGETGLERFLRQPQYLSMEKMMLPLRYQSGAYMDENGEIRPAIPRLRR
ncbi:hypothetical protein C8A03DRAFT_31850 [Achaetomium macrosporum]|uniref:Protoporphyrinogen oxidase n=1 Tax=Achaetomium macrosporum TaxID=79813 RepID=A0AAN7CDF9_9PEZI|nr:hypothetical protein C8A03DRAFT_31850 [Achaetomium macrosporum]